MSQLMHVSCTGQEFQPHARVTFELKLDHDGGPLQYAVAQACPVCQLNEKVAHLDSMVQAQWDDTRKAKARAEDLEDMVASLRPMLEWWEATCKIKEALEQPESEGNQPGDPR